MSARVIQVSHTPDGAVTYLVAIPVEALPPVRSRDLAAAWDAARDAATGAIWGAERMFRFRRADGGTLDLALHDDDARCWAGAVDVTAGMQTSYGLSLCMRLLALVALMARAPWLAGLYRLSGAGVHLDPALLRAAAEAELTPDAQFDDTGFRRHLAVLPASGDMT